MVSFYISVEYVGWAFDDVGRVVLARIAMRVFVDNSVYEEDRDIELIDVLIIDGVVSFYEGLI